MKQSLAGLPQNEIETLLTESLPALRGELGYNIRAKQIYKWIARGVSGFEQMTDIPALMQKQLQERFALYSSAVTSCHEDGDAKKIVITLNDGLKIEAVLLSDGKNRLTACISTQAGCPARCVFCMTGSLKFKRNLSYGEIVEQYLHLRRIVNISGRDADAQKSQINFLPQTGTNRHEHLIDNIVVMGMGEPLLNLGNLRKAADTLNDKAGLNFSRRRITVSTCGICDGLFEIAKEPFVRLALSLTTGDEELRRELMPITKSNPLDKAHEALKLFQDNNGGRVTLEIPLLGGINTRGKDAKSVAEFARGLDAVVNIIPWNPVNGFKFKGNLLREPEKKETTDFIKMLESYGLKTTMRLHKGQRIMGACGQLGSTD